MALSHTHVKALTRSKGNTVGNLAYRAGTTLRCELTGELFTYANKPVQHVELLLPIDAPEWAKELRELIAQDRIAGVQQLSNLAESAEKRKDAQVYREVEFALPRELTDAQCIELARELVQDQLCSKGMAVLLNFHFDRDEKTGERKPHCHAVMLTRRLTEHGLSAYKEREWNNRGFAAHFHEQHAAYTNFHLAKHGFEARIDHRSYQERGIKIEPQPKLGYGVTKMEAIEGNDPRNIYSATVTERGYQFQQIKLRNLYRLVKNPEMVFEIVTKNHATFMWGDVEEVLGRYIDDAELYQRMNDKLKASSELVLLRERATAKPYEDVEAKPVFTTRSMLKTEQSLVQLADKLSQRQSHRISSQSLQNTLQAWDQKLGKYGGLSSDQKAALQHMVGSQQLSYVVGYAGAGKTTVLEAAKEIWEANGYTVYGLAPTGRAAQNLDSVGIKSQTVHKFLKAYESGRNQLDVKSVLVLDEAGMVDVARCEELLTAVKRLGVKLVGVGDGAQLQSVESGAAFRLITERIPHAKLETVVRQREGWQRQATQLFGQLKTAEAVQQYMKRGCVEIVDEPTLDLDALMEQMDYRGMVLAYNQSRRVAGVIYHDMLQDLKAKYFLEKDVRKYLPSHQDYALFKEWKERRETCAEFMKDHLDNCRPYLQELGVDPVKFAVNFVNPEFQGDARQAEARRLAQEWELPRLSPEVTLHQCDIRGEARTALLKAWRASMIDAPEKSQIILTYTNKDTLELNQQARQLMKEAGRLALEEYTFKIVHEDLDDFGTLQKFEEERRFAQGDRLVFLRNDNSLKVKNGTLGTILEVNHQKMVVKLDGEERTVSFSPNLYPHIDHGWATTIHKAQGVTVDRSFVLATHQTYRNLAYVAFTRHREALKVFGSNLDFWRPAKVWEALSQSQDKLSSLDYLDAGEALKKMRQDDHIISRVLDKIGNRLTAVQVVSIEAWKRLGERFLGHTRPSFMPAIQGVLTEESRARLLLAEELLGNKPDQDTEVPPQTTPAFIAAQKKGQDKGTLQTAAPQAIPAGRDQSSSSTSPPEVGTTRSAQSLTVDQPSGTTPIHTEQRPLNPLIKGKIINPVAAMEGMHKEQQGITLNKPFPIGSTQRAGQDKPQPKDIEGKEAPITASILETVAGQPQPASEPSTLTTSPELAGQPVVDRIEPSLITVTPASLSPKLKEAVPTSNLDHSKAPSKHAFQPLHYYQRDAVLDSLDTSKVERIFVEHIHHWVDKPQFRRLGDELRFGGKGGFAVNLKTTQWFSHYTNEGGDIFTFISAARGLSYKEAIRWIGEYTGAPTVEYISVEEQQRRHAAALQEQQREQQQRKEAARVKTEQVYKYTQPIQGTLAEKYLREVRGIQGDIPETVRFAPKRFTEGKTYPALVSFAYDAEGKLSCYQDIMLDAATGGKAKGLEVVKKSHGVLKGAAVTLQKGEGITYVAEGLETGLSLKEAGVTGEILVSLGQSNIRNVVPTNKQVVICGDYDAGSQSNTEKAADKNAQHLKELGYEVTLIWPETKGEKRVDFNDLLKDHGVQKIKQVLEEQLPDVVTFKKDMVQAVQQESHQKQPENPATQPRFVQGEVKPLNPLEQFIAANEKDVELGLRPAKEIQAEKQQVYQQLLKSAYEVSQDQKLMKKAAEMEIDSAVQTFADIYAQNHGLQQSREIPVKATVKPESLQKQHDALEKYVDLQKQAHAASLKMHIDVKAREAFMNLRAEAKQCAAQVEQNSQLMNRAAQDMNLTKSIKADALSYKKDMEKATKQRDRGFERD
jgi:Ti-type conjugative transfer relaxase TraA